MAVKCPKCQHDNPENTKFCGECGASLSVDLGSLSPTRTILVPVMHLRKGQRIARKYKIIEKIGEGGMGIVYRAEDIKLKRHVALKFLPSELTRDKKAKARFTQEAQAAAALNHPHICIIHEVDETDDQTFIAMEFIEGQTLKDKIEAGPLAIDEAVEIATQVAEGLGEAHKKGIVHRDIKPANIVLTEKGQAKIMDFGLAKLSWGAGLTKPSMIMGTVAYMSPEQARGEPVDHRTDIWSLGAMLYEMLAGEKPFQKSQEHALIHSILNDEPRRISDLRSDVPGFLEKAINKALEKNADRRFQTAEELLHELKQSPRLVFPEAKKSIVVLPFGNLSPDPDQEYFCDGMTEEIITDLSHIHDLLVISRSSAMTFKGTRSTIKEIADKVNVRYVLEGSVRKAGNNLRITAQLIDAKTDAHLWAEKYSGNLDDVFDIQEKVSRSIVNALKLKLSPQELEQIAQRPIDNIKAYECHLRARREMLRTTEEGLKRALQELETGIEIMGDNPLLYMDMALVYFWYIEYGIKADEESLKKAEELAQRVAQLSPNSWISHYLRGMIIRFRGSALHALEYFKKALVINPDIPEALLMLSGGYSYLAGKVDAAKPMITRLLEIDPLTPLNYHIAGIVYWMNGQLDESISAMEKMMKMEPDSPYPHVWRLYPMVWKKQYDEVIANIDQFVQQEDIDQAGKGVVEWCLFLKYALQGDKKSALDSVSKEVNRWAWNDPDLPWFWAGLYALINEKEKAIDWLERAVDRGFINYPLIAEQDPFIENIRSEPRFKKLMERVKHEWENFEV